MLSTCQVSDQLDHSNRNYGKEGGGAESAPPPPAISIFKKPGLFGLRLRFQILVIKYA